MLLALSLYFAKLSLYYARFNKTLKKQAKMQPDLEAKLALHRQAKDLEAQRSQKRRALYDAQDDIDRRKESLISEVEARLQQSVQEEALLTIRWQIR